MFRVPPLSKDSPPEALTALLRPTLDVYMFGGLVFEVMLGVCKPPFFWLVDDAAVLAFRQNNDANTVEAAIAAGHSVRSCINASTWSGCIDPVSTLHDLMMWCLQRHPATRPPTMRVVLDVLDGRIRLSGRYLPLQAVQRASGTAPWSIVRPLDDVASVPPATTTAGSGGGGAGSGAGGSSGGVGGPSRAQGASTSAGDVLGGVGAGAGVGGGGGGGVGVGVGASGAKVSTTDASNPAVALDDVLSVAESLGWWPVTLDSITDRVLSLAVAASGARLKTVLEVMRDVGVRAPEVLRFHATFTARHPRVVGSSDGASY
jgi:hypothetical protein